MISENNNVGGAGNQQPNEEGDAAWDYIKKHYYLI